MKSDQPSAGDGTIRERLEAKMLSLKAQVQTCEHILHTAPLGCPYCQRDTKLIALLRDAAAALPVAAPLLPALRALEQQWRDVKEIKDMGEFGASFEDDGYAPDGFRGLRLTESKIFTRCADELAALLDPLTSKTATRPADKEEIVQTSAQER